MKRNYYRFYIIIVILILVIPFAGMTLWPTNETTEKKELASMPSMIQNGKYNVRYMQELGNYFEDHFAFRQYFVTANALIDGKLLHTSATDQVVIGNDGWLYFGGTINDYIGSDRLSNREKIAVVHNIKIMQSYVESQGCQFVIAIVPNKNTIYDENMPSSYKRSDESNLNTLYTMMKREGIHCIDLKETLTNLEEPLYFKRDTHWNNKGAYEAYKVFMQAIQKDYDTYDDIAVTTKNSHVGDLDEMLYPYAYEKEKEYVYQIDWNYTYVNDVEDAMTSWIETENKKESGTLLMYRDSFGEALLPFMAQNMGKAYFSRLVPYNLTQVGQYNPDYVIIERVERKIAAFATEIPIMSSPRVKIENGMSVQTNSTIQLEDDGVYTIIKGVIDETYMQDDTEIYVTVRDQNTMVSNTYQAFYSLTKDGNGNGYQVNIPNMYFPKKAHINLEIKDKDGIKIVSEKELKEN